MCEWDVEEDNGINLVLDSLILSSCLETTIFFCQQYKENKKKKSRKGMKIIEPHKIYISFVKYLNYFIIVLFNFPIRKKIKTYMFDKGTSF